jgi:thiamine kinase-like enzyme
VSNETRDKKSERTHHNEKSSIWKLLLPPHGKSSVILIAGQNVNLLSKELSKDYQQIFSYAFHERNETTQKDSPLSQPKYPNIIPLQDLTAKESMTAVRDVSVVIFFLSTRFLKEQDPKSVVGDIDQVLSFLSSNSKQSLTYLFIVPKKYYYQFPNRLYHPWGLTTTKLNRLAKRYNLNPQRLFHCSPEPEQINSIRIDNFLLPSMQESQIDGCLSIKRFIKSTRFCHPSHLMLFSNTGKYTSCLDRLLIQIKERLALPKTITVTRYFAANPDNLLLKLESKPDKKFICRIPLSEGVSTKRTIDNFINLKWLNNLSAIKELVPRALLKDQIKNYSFFVEGHLAGHTVRLNQHNLPSYYRLIRPILLKFHNHFGSKVFIDDIFFHELCGDGLDYIKQLAFGKPELDIVLHLEEKLKNAIMNRTFILPVVHGDFKIENMLFSGAKLTGIFDWDLAMRHGFPFIDLFYLLGYSFYLEKEGPSYGIIKFITSQLMSCNHATLLKEYFRDYQTSLNIDKVLIEWSGILFWMHYITKIRRSVFVGGDSYFYDNYFKSPLQNINKIIEELN